MDMRGKLSHPSPPPRLVDTDEGRGYVVATAQEPRPPGSQDLS